VRNSGSGRLQRAVFQIVSKFTIKVMHPVVAGAPAQVNRVADEDEALARHFVCP